MQAFCQGRRPTLRKTLLAAAAIGAFPLAAFAKDLPPTSDGAQQLAAVFATYLGKPAAGAPSPISVTAEGAHYAVAIDLASLAEPLKAAGVSIDPAILKYSLTEQDDGAWRVTGDALPAIGVHAEENAIAYEFGGYNFDGIYDPALAAFKNAETSLENMTAQVHAPSVDETVSVGKVHATQTASPAPNGAVTAAVHEELADFSISVLATPRDAAAGADAAPTSVKIQMAGAVADVGLDGISIRKLLDLWTFAVAHPSRSEIAANEPAFKDLLRAALPSDAKITEKVDTQKIGVETPKGSFSAASGKFGLAASTAPGPKGSLEYQVAADGITLPPGLLPPGMQDLAPTAVNFDVRLSGFDLGAGAAEAINDMHFAGEGPVIADVDRPKILAKTKGAGPILIELLPSHLVAPRVDVTIEAQVHLEGVRPSGTLKVHARNFDNTVAAVKGLGPMASPQMIGALAMAKGLAKAESDGALVWVAEYGADGSVKVNGLPLGKAP